MEAKINNFMELVRERNGHEPEFLQAVQEVAETVIPYIASKDIYNGKNILLIKSIIYWLSVVWCPDNGC